MACGCLCQPIGEAQPILVLKCVNYIKVIQEIMGHADIETTMNIYAEAAEQKKKESFANLEGKIKIS